MAIKKIDELFGLPERMKIMRLFVFNPDKAFDTEMIVQKTGLKKAIAAREVNVLKRSGLIIGKKFSKTVSEKPKVTKKVSGFGLDQAFGYLAPVRAFLLATSPSAPDVLKRLASTGKLRLVILAGVFIQDPESRLDILIVGDKLKENVIRKAVASLESDIGKELSYFVVSSQDFAYRTSMNDKLLRDVLDFPHQKVLNKLGV